MVFEQTYGVPWTREDYFHERLNKLLSDALAQIRDSADNAQRRENVRQYYWRAVLDFRLAIGTCKGKINSTLEEQVYESLEEVEHLLFASGDAEKVKSNANKAAAALLKKVNPLVHQVLNDADLLLPRKMGERSVSSIGRSLGIQTQTHANLEA